ncbi:MAG: hypothetical protein JW889_03860 [Verrucomicrobia bacterium]|nr:hypothetical protein [Verrucomicrobiota bacterium]
MSHIVSIAALGHAAVAGLPLVAAGSFGLFHLYLIFLVLGGGYAVISFFLSSVGGDHDVGSGDSIEIGHDFDVDHDLGVGHDTDVGHDVGHGAEQGELAVADASLTQLGPFSPMIVAMFMACFGLAGVIFTTVLPIGFFSFLPSVACGVGGAWLMLTLVNKLFAATEASSEAEAWRLVGQEALVITPIPEKGVGEIQYVARGSTFSAPARTSNGVPLERGMRATIVDASQTIFTVRKSIEERFRDLEHRS